MFVTKHDTNFCHLSSSASAVAPVEGPAFGSLGKRECFVSRILSLACLVITYPHMSTHLPAYMSHTHRVLGSLVISRLEDRTVSLEEKACSLEDKAPRSCSHVLSSAACSGGTVFMALCRRGRTEYWASTAPSERSHFCDSVLIRHTLKFSNKCSS